MFWTNRDDAWSLFLHGTVHDLTIALISSLILLHALYPHWAIVMLHYLQCPWGVIISFMSKSLQKTQLKWQFSLILSSALRAKLNYPIDRGSQYIVIIIPMSVYCTLLSAPQGCVQVLIIFISFPQKEFLVYYRYIINCVTVVFGIILKN